ncbi:sulfotransferase 1C1-like [Spea bombifrons]|uniref:sulfotransferase 1C1-like n=1 Tax=Spea bombifrons TaxID=233779 RepID=UPI00234BC246|nr:sulfotransferase 1C1-like [Spea bombifrons]
MDRESLEEMAKGMENFTYSSGLIEGVPFPKALCDSWDTIYNFGAREDDVLIATYPKAGTTCTQEIVDLMLQDGDVAKAMRAPTFVKVPFIELVLPKPVKTGVEMANDLESPRLLKTHLPIELLPPSFWEKNVKVIYVARNAKDCMVSYFYFQKMSKILPDPGSWNDHFSTFLAGEVPWGSWFDHVIGWWNARDKHRILYIFYEDMIEDPKREMRNMTKFLNINLSEDVLEKIKDHTSFQAMKKNPMTNSSAIPSSLMDRSVSQFMRKGIVGDWKNHFTVAQNVAFDEEYEKKMKGIDLTFRTEL